MSDENYRSQKTSTYACASTFIVPPKSRYFLGAIFTGSGFHQSLK